MTDTTSGFLLAGQHRVANGNRSVASRFIGSKLIQGIAFKEIYEGWATSGMLPRHSAGKLQARTDWL